ncbi:hypothetical protein AB0C52_15285 [Streptomyces sp. NPDC048717]|uniref:hypothetical protein n=1 Tax=Streptomyces sp. NPDC048717 TaxID=3154928 RepID=UPI00341425BD
MSSAPPSPNNDPSPTPAPSPATDSGSRPAASPPRPSGPRRARAWFGGLSEAGKVGLVTAALTTIGGGVFGLANAALSDSPSGAKTPAAGPPAQAAPCEVRDEFMHCTVAKAEIKVYRDRAYDSGSARTLTAGETVRFRCWGHGDAQPGGGDIWYWTQFKDQDYKGNVAAVDLNTGSVAPAGLHQC